MPSEILVVGLYGIPEVTSGDDISHLIFEALARQDILIEPGDILVVTQKIISKSEGRIIMLDDVEPSPAAIQISKEHHRDPRHTEIILRESARIIRMEKGNIISETHHGFKCANAGVDASNVPRDGAVALLPVDPDASAARIREGIKDRLDTDVAVIVSDTFGRPWREGAVNVAIGVAGMGSFVDYMGKADAYGRIMRTTLIAVVDELAAAAELVTGKVDGVPVSLIRGYQHQPYDPETLTGAKALIRPPERDMFR